jgi:hypothetical protein
VNPRHAPVQFSAPDLEAVEKVGMQFKNADLAPRTISSYQSGFRTFQAWCRAAGRAALPPSAGTVELCITDLIGRGRKITTAERHSVGIKHAILPSVARLSRIRPFSRISRCRKAQEFSSRSSPGVWLRCATVSTMRTKRVWILGPAGVLGMRTGVPYQSRQPEPIIERHSPAGRARRAAGSARHTARTWRRRYTHRRHRTYLRRALGCGAARRSSPARRSDGEGQGVWASDNSPPGNRRYLSRRPTLFEQLLFELREVPVVARGDARQDI